MNRIMNVIEKALNKKRCRLAISVCLSAILVFIMTFSDRVAPFDDDWAISEVLSGRFPDSGLCLFVNALISHVTLALNEAMPFLNWFMVIERVLAFIACATFNYAVSTFVSPVFAFFLIAGAEYFLLPFTTYFGNFTFVASFCTLAGGSLLLGNMTSRVKRPRISTCILGVFLCVCGFLMRGNAFILALPFLGVAFIFIMIDLFHGTGFKQRPMSIDAFTRILPVIVTFLLVGCAYVYNSYAWSQPGWQEWEQFNDYRAQISDFPMPQYDEVADRMQEAGVSEEAYALACNWATADPEMFTIERMAAIASVSRVNSLGEILEKGIAYPTDLADHLKPLAFFIATVMLGIFMGNKRSWIGLAIVSIMGYCACVVFFGMGRLLDRIEYPIYMYVATCIAFINGHDLKPRIFAKNPASAQKIMTLATCFIFVLMTCYELYKACGHFDVGQIEKSISQEDYQPSGEMMDYVMADDDKVYVWDPYPHVLFEGIYEQKYLPTARFLEKNLSTGGWTSNAPFILACGVAAGVPNVIKDLATADNAYYVTYDQAAVDRILNYLRAEYFPDASVQLIDEIGVYRVYKFIA